MLVGMMGAGKSTVGQLAAERLGWAYADSDAEIERVTGRTVPEILRSDGEDAFRREESAVLRRALSHSGPVVVSVAGGAVLDPANRSLIRAAGPVVWLRATVATLAARVGPGQGRPLLGSDPQAAIERLYATRRPLYAEVADATVDVEGLTPEKVVDRVLAAAFADSERVE